jgi:hypothetical protein
MKAISLHQPWASLVAYGFKRYETRSWDTAYVGPIAIHAAKQWSKAQRDFWQALRARYDGICSVIPGTLPLGAIICVTHVLGTRPTMGLGRDALEDALGDFSWGRFAWALGRPLRLPTPKPCLGRQGFFNVEL